MQSEHHGAEYTSKSIFSRCFRESEVSEIQPEMPQIKGRKNFPRLICAGAKKRRRMPAALVVHSRYALVQQQRTVCLLFADLAVEELIVVEIDLDERRAGFYAALDQRL